MNGKFGVGPLVSVSIVTGDKYETLTCEYLGLTFETELGGAGYRLHKRVAVLTEAGNVLTVRLHEIKFQVPPILPGPQDWGPR